MAITLDLFRNGAVGFIDWLDAGREENTREITSTFLAFGETLDFEQLIAPPSHDSEAGPR